MSLVSENKLKKKWKYLRDQFSVELGKLPPPRSGDAAGAVTPKWAYFSQLLFLKDTVKPRMSTGNLTQDEESIIIPERNLDETESESNVQSAENDGAGGLDANVEESEKEVHPVLEPHLRILNSSASTVKKRRGQNDIFNDTILDIEKKKLDYLQSKSKRVDNKEDDHLLFFKSLLPHVRKIPDSRVLSFRSRVQELVDHFAYQLNISPAPRTPISSSLLSSPSLTPIPNSSLSPHDFYSQSRILPPLNISSSHHPTDFSLSLPDQQQQNFSSQPQTTSFSLQSSQYHNMQ